MHYDYFSVERFAACSDCCVELGDSYRRAVSGSSQSAAGNWCAHDVEHFLIFSATGLAFGLGYERKHGLLAILLLIFVGSIEITQLFVPGRHARLSDFIVDAFAMCVGLVIVSLISRIRAQI